MARPMSSHGTPVLVGVLVVALSAAAAQGVLQQLDVSEADAKGLALSALTDGYVQYGVASEAMKALPAAARGPLVDAGIAWTRAYVGSPAFAAEYAAYREGQKPQPPDDAGSVDDEMKEELAKQQQDIEDTKKNMASLPPEVREGMAEAIKQMESMMQDPQMRQMMRADIENRRAEAKRTYESDLKEWESDYPADAGTLVARRLRAFLDVSADVDFAVPLVDRDGMKKFADAQFERKPAEWKLCYRAGKEATAAARVAATAWLQELEAR